MRFGICAFLTLVIPMMGIGGEPPYQRDRFFRTQILPLLQLRCFKCHSREHEDAGGLALDSKTGWQTGGEAGSAITPGDLKYSPLI